MPLASMAPCCVEEGHSASCTSECIKSARALRLMLPECATAPLCIRS